MTDGERLGGNKMKETDSMATSGQGDAGWRVPSQSMTRFICCRQAARALERLEDPIVFLRSQSLIGTPCNWPRWKQLEVDWQSKAVEIAPVGRDGWEGLPFPFQPCRARNSKTMANDSRDYHTVSNTSHTV
ncbi:uncharacterized protein BO96DRAFT_430860 [Aspergillus niger CBS 101883]|uniref:Uncharacterized protein n=2 Tax=Aspergillus niger TaxID=5061 RepID=A2RBL6_ASPNC|nr:uncharacterized protein BO96DRAFT_430860 [Aspergillus niger CBS 101883]XP_059605075.1 hypothetical protein An19g00310 [Aspergillus niger]PYH59756.1 hypothetical protein BO96DRAFT_430860 [Aspergillus niger CBS 101883]CAK47354.1 hypothetical protein An19g00310 [Aspergillus niger]